jgi:hypothetical protein
MILKKLNETYCPISIEFYFIIKKIFFKIFFLNHTPVNKHIQFVYIYTHNYIYISNFILQ